MPLVSKFHEQAWGEITHDLKLQGNDPEIENLHCRPEQEVRFQRWEVHLLELACYGSSSTALGDGHKREEGCQTYSSY